MTVRAALQQGQQLLEDAGVAVPRLTAEVLLTHAISLSQTCDRAWLYAHASDELRELWWIHYGRFLHERMQGKPTQYITGRQEFYGREFHVSPDVLIPRPETEHVVEAALSRITGAPRILDIGAGSGAIAITLALETKAHVMATDISPAALGVAQENARRFDANVSLTACDLGSAFAHETFDMVVSNPPYVPARDLHNIQREVREFEPGLALYGGEDGLDVYRRLIPEAARLLKSGGWLIMELGYAGLDPVREMLANWNDVEAVCDLAGLPRVIVASKS
ncbi:MAG TPA: peptide chain release factor N(5)-glutamine methyltransferase [Bryobacteraceae bacterium]|nr:peptide chain release factor N(5)-glutamine methyltransferase [Bryobacteraceae bacterium]